MLENLNYDRICMLHFIFFDSLRSFFIFFEIILECQNSFKNVKTGVECSVWPFLAVSERFDLLLAFRKPVLAAPGAAFC